MRDIIEVDKELIPYSFNIALAGEEFNMAFDYNKTADLFTCTLSKNGEVVVYNEPLIYGVELFADVYKADLFPAIALVPFDESGNENAITYANFGETVFLVVDDQEEITLPVKTSRVIGTGDTANKTTSKLGEAVLGSMILGE